MPEQETQSTVVGSSPATPETPAAPALIDAGARTGFPQPSFTANLNRTPEQQAAFKAAQNPARSADASQAPGGAIEDASADPNDFAQPQAYPQDIDEDGGPDPEPATVGGRPNDPGDDPYSDEAVAKLPYHEDKRFQQFLADRRALEAQKAEVARLQAFAPLVNDLQGQGFASYEALQAKIAEQEQAAQAAQQQAQDAAYEQQLHQQAESRYIDEADQQLFVEMHMRTLRAERASEQAQRIAEESRANYQATLTQQAEAQKYEAYTQAVAAHPILRTFAPNGEGKGIGQRTLEEAILSGRYGPAEIRQIGSEMARDYQAAIDAAVTAAKAEAAKALKKSASAPASLGTRGQTGGKAPATGQVMGTPNNGFKAAAQFTRFLNRPNS